MSEKKDVSISVVENEEAILTKYNSVVKYDVLYYPLPILLCFSSYGFIHYMFQVSLFGLLVTAFELIYMEIFWFLISKTRTTVKNNKLLKWMGNISIAMMFCVVIASFVVGMIFERSDTEKIQLIFLWLNTPLYVYYTATLCHISDIYE